jgi:hypothetical protein
MERDEDVRTSCFSRLALLQAQYGDELPYAGALSDGFPFRGRRVPFLNYQKGIYRAAVQRGPAALSIQTSARSPYADVETADGFFYDYRSGSIDQPDNRALRSAADQRCPSLAVHRRHLRIRRERTHEPCTTRLVSSL